MISDFELEKYLFAVVPAYFKLDTDKHCTSYNCMVKT